MLVLDSRERTDVGRRIAQLAQILAAIWLAVVPIAASAGETVTYTYDELGRLVAVSSTGTVNDGVSVSTQFDPAGNRNSHAVTGGSTPSISIANAAVTEGGQLVFVATRAGSLAGINAVNYSTTNGTAVTPGDYLAVSGTVTFGVGETSKNIPVTTIDDSTVETAETLTVALSSPTNGATLGTAIGTGTINDNDAAFADLSLGHATVVEGGAASFVVTRSGNVSTAVSASYATNGGSAVSGSDFTSTSGSVNFIPNQTTASILVQTINDSSIEPTETFTLTLSSPSSGANIVGTSGTGTISDNDSSLVVGDATATEGGVLSFQVTRTGTISTAVSASYATSGGTAVSGTDFVPATGTVSFGANQTSATISINTIEDSTYETPENLTVVLSNPSTDATISNTTGTGTINDNDVAPATLAISDAPTVTEGGTLVFTVARSGNTTIAASASFTTVNGTALSGSDYTFNSGTVSFAAGETSKPINVVTTDDAVVETQENLTVTLSVPGANTTITTANATGLINDNDVAPPTLAIGDASATEGGILIFTVTRSGDTTGSTSVNYATANGTAIANDYFAVSGTLTFAPGETSRTISVAAQTDTRVEFDEVFYVNISGATGGATIIDGQGQGTIFDDGTSGCPTCR